VFSALTEDRQAVVLAAYAHELTIVARDGYEAGTERLSNPLLLRRLNEVQHRVASAILDRLQGNQERYPDDVLIDIVVGGGDDLGRRLHASFCRAWQVALGVPIKESLPQ
jgi:hypothetical protein